MKMCNNISKEGQRMTKILPEKIIYNFFYLAYIINEKFINNQTKRNYMADKFLEYNNRRTLKKIGKSVPKNIALLLPHCIQNYDCPFRITSDIENCRKCGKCKIQKLLELKEKYDSSECRFNIKVATGGTLARLFIKENKPDLIIAVACKRDLISGIFDTFPMKVYGVYNKIINCPCINTDLDVEEVEKVVRKVRKID